MSLPTISILTYTYTHICFQISSRLSIQSRKYLERVAEAFEVSWNAINDKKKANMLLYAAKHKHELIFMRENDKNHMAMNNMAQKINFPAASLIHSNRWWLIEHVAHLFYSKSDFFFFFADFILFSLSLFISIRKMSCAHTFMLHRRHVDSQLIKLFIPMRMRGIKRFLTPLSITSSCFNHSFESE